MIGLAVIAVTVTAVTAVAAAATARSYGVTETVIGAANG